MVVILLSWIVCVSNLEEDMKALVSLQYSIQRFVKCIESFYRRYKTITAMLDVSDCKTGMKWLGEPHRVGTHRRPVVL